MYLESGPYNITRGAYMYMSNCSNIDLIRSVLKLLLLKFDECFQNILPAFSRIEAGPGSFETLRYFTGIIGMLVT